MYSEVGVAPSKSNNPNYLNGFGPALDIVISQVFKTQLEMINMFKNFVKTPKPTARAVVRTAEKRACTVTAAMNGTRRAAKGWRFRWRGY